MVGKIVDHFCFIVDEETRGWFKGVVLKNMGKGEFLIRYNDFPEETFSQPLYQDFKAGQLKLVELVPTDLIDASIRHLYTDNESGEDTWWNAEVVDIDPESEDKINPDFFIMYEESGDCDTGTLERQEYYLDLDEGDH